LNALSGKRQVLKILIKEIFIMKRFKHVIKAFGLFIVLSGFGVKPSVFALNSLDESAEQHKPAEAEKNEGNKDLNDLENEVCEHKIKIIDCDKCRFEAGVVKIQSAIGEKLITTGKAETRNLSKTIQVTGAVEFDQTGLADILSPASGRVIQINALLGQKVKAGDILASLHSADFGGAKAEYLKAHVNLEVRRKEAERTALINNTLEKLINSADDNKESFEINTGRNESRGEPVGEWKSKLGGAQSRLKLAVSAFEREKNLWEKQIASKSEYENASQELKVARIEYSSLLEEIELQIRTDKLHIENEIKLAEADLRVAKQRLQIFGFDNDRIQSLIEEKESNDFNKLDLYSPRAGTVIAQNITEGKLIDPSQSVYTIADLSNVWVWCDLYEKDLAILESALSEGKPVEARVKVGAFKGEIFKGSVDLIKSSVDENTHAVKVRVQVKNENEKLRQGMFADVEILIPSNRTGVLLPKDAVLSDEGVFFVFQHLKNDLWVRRNVKIGRAHGKYIEIIDGFDKKKQVVTSGAFMLKSDILRGKMGAVCAE
jgi:cobalt-zinc-cadmium efflux system membrane fusion protein